MLTTLLAAVAVALPAQTVTSSEAYVWHADTITQGKFKAWAESPETIKSTYHGRPGYFMPVDQLWTRRNDISSYPRMSGSNRLLEAVYNMGLDEMVNAVEPDTTLRTGKEWAGVWTRDVSYSIILAMAALQPEAAMHSLMKKVNAQGQIIQDTGSGGAWPISTDRLVWTLAAWEIYKYTGSRQWLEKVFPIAARSIAKDQGLTMNADGLLPGETSFIDWREQSYPRWMQTADIAESTAMSTNMVYAASLNVLADMAQILGKKADARDYRTRAEEVTGKINQVFWNEEMGDFHMYNYGRDHKMSNPRYETLGSSLAILYDIATPEQAARMTENHPVTPYGVPVFFPQITDMPNYHNNALWPFVASYWALANAKAGNEQGTLQAIGSVMRPAALFCTNKENLNLDNGDIYTELNSSNMLWSLSGNLALTMRILFGIHFEPEGIRLAPFVPRALADTRTLEGLKYRGATLNVTVSGFGSEVKEITLNGKPVKSDNGFIPANKLKGVCDLRVIMADNEIAPMQINMTANVKAPLTPQARLTQSETAMEWNPIEYIAGYEIYRNGQLVDSTRQTRYELTGPGLWQVVGVSDRGVRSFASEPLYVGELQQIEMPDEGISVTSAEVSYSPATPVAGYSGAGFVETDHTTPAIKVPIDVENENTYYISLRYANGNGPVNTENKSAVRSLTIDGRKVGTIVMPQRGVANWDDWGLSNGIAVTLTPGQHVIGIELLPDDENMNLHTNHALIDAIMLRGY